MTGPTAKKQKQQLVPESKLRQADKCVEVRGSVKCSYSFRVFFHKILLIIEKKRVICSGGDLATTTLDSRYYQEQEWDEPKSGPSLLWAWPQFPLPLPHGSLIPRRHQTSHRTDERRGQEGTRNLHGLKRAEWARQPEAEHRRTADPVCSLAQQGQGSHGLSGCCFPLG